MHKNRIISVLFVIAMSIGLLSSFIENQIVVNHLLSASTVLIIYVLLSLDWSEKTKLSCILLFFLTFIILALLSYFH